MEKSFDNTIDYAPLHLVWIQDNRNRHFALANAGKESSYYDIMRSVYAISNPQECLCGKFPGRHTSSNHYAYSQLCMDIRSSKKSSTVIENLEKTLSMEGITPTNKFFITIGFNHQTFNALTAVTAVKRLLQKDFVLEGEGVFEYFRENGEHPHFHMILTVPKMRNGMVVTKIFQSAGMSRIVLSRNFIDVKEFQPYHQKYLDGDKIEEKLEYCKKDFDWRIKNNIPHKINK